MKRVFLLVGIKFLLFLFISYLVKTHGASINNFSFPDDLLTYRVPDFIAAFANFDGIHYIKVARSEYYESAQAFFPLFPVFIKLGSLIIKNALITGLIISNLSLVFGLYILLKLLEDLKIKERWWVVLFILSFPTAFYFQTVYSESLFFLFVILFFYFLRSKYVLLSGLSGLFAALTRIAGVLLVVPYVAYLYLKKSRPIEYMYGFLPVVGLLLYMIFLWFTSGDPLKFFHAQSAFGAGRSTSLVLFPQVLFRYLKIFATVDLGWNLFIAALEFAAFVTFFSILVYDLYGRFRRREFLLFSVSLFSLLLIILPTFTGTFLSMPRFSLTAVGFFIFLGTRIKGVAYRALLLIGFSSLQLTLFCYFILGRFVS